MEERSRNEWNNFKADDQKRWINNSLVVEEKIREISKKEERLEERVTFLEDRTLEIKDVLSQFMGNSNREFSKIINLLKEWFDETEGLTGRLG